MLPLHSKRLRRTGHLILLCYLLIQAFYLFSLPLATFSQPDNRLLSLPNHQSELSNFFSMLRLSETMLFLHNANNLIEVRLDLLFGLQQLLSIYWGKWLDWQSEPVDGFHKVTEKQLDFLVFFFEEVDFLKLLEQESLQIFELGLFLLHKLHDAALLFFRSIGLIRLVVNVINSGLWLCDLLCVGWSLALQVAEHESTFCPLCSCL